MKEFRRKLQDVLVEKFGVERAFAAQLMPLLEAVARTRPTAEDWERVLTCVAAAHHSRGEAHAELDESRGLIRQFLTELERMDESLKVLAVYLDRLRDTLGSPDRGHTLH